MGTELTWIDRAYGAWLAHLDKAAGFAHETKVSGSKDVLLLGLTQNGKTTLALRLLDAVDPKGIGDALRGGRKQGQSATPGPIGYVAALASETMDKDSLAERVRQIYEAYLAAHPSNGTPVGDGDTPFQAPPIIAIPSTAEPGAMTLVDMAGFDGRESWAEQDAEYWTARADYTLLVIRADRVSGITGADFAAILPRLLNRWIHAGTILVVTTHAFEVNLSEEEKALDWDQFREKRADELFSILSGRGLERSQVELFPVSFTDEEPARTHTERSLRALKARLQVDHSLNRLANAEVIRHERRQAMQGQKADLERQVAEGEVCRTRFEEDIKTLDCFAGKDYWPTPVFVAFPMSSTDGCEDFHDKVRQTEPTRMLAHYQHQLGLSFDKVAKAMAALERELTMYFNSEVAAPLRRKMERNLIEPEAGCAIPEPEFKVRKRNMWTFGLAKSYDAGASSKGLAIALENREHKLAESAKSLYGFHDKMGRALLEIVWENLRIEKMKVQDNIQIHSGKQKLLLNEIRHLEARFEALPQIPGLANELQTTFTEDWNQTLLAAEEAGDNETLARSFLQLWALQESLGDARAHLDRKNLD